MPVKFTKETGLASTIRAGFVRNYSSNKNRAYILQRVVASVYTRLYFVQAPNDTDGPGLGRPSWR